MKRVTLAALILTATGLAGATTWTAGTRTAAGPVWSAGVPIPRELAAAKAPVPAVASASAATGTARKVTATPAPPADPARPEAATTAAPHRHTPPAPFVQTFAAQPGVQKQKPKAKPTAPVKVAATIDGCDRNYGTIAQCIPLTFPKGVPDKCVWLTAHGFQNLKVVGQDRQKLDPDHNDIACG